MTNQKAIVGMSVSEEKRSRSPISMKEKRLSEASKYSNGKHGTFSEISSSQQKEHF